MKTEDMLLAKEIALELCDRKTDVNEVMKAVAYLRAHRDTHALFTLLDSMIQNGRHVVRTGQTLRYYRNMREVFAKDLAGFRNARGDEADRVVQILAWSARLMRYFYTEEGSDERLEHESARGRPSKPETHATDGEPPTNRQQDLPPRKEEPRKPRVETVKEWVTAAGAVKGGKVQVKTEQGELIPCTNPPGFPEIEAGDRFRADVTREDEKAVRAVFKGWK